MVTTIVWFRRDLRLSDHPALIEAHPRRAGRGLGRAGLLPGRAPVEPSGRQPAGLPRRLPPGASTRTAAATWSCARGDPVRVLPALAEEVGAAEVFVTARLRALRRRAGSRRRGRAGEGGRSLGRVGSPYAVDPGTVPSGSGEPYKVFTPFSKAWAAHGWPGPRPAPASVPLGGGGADRRRSPTRRSRRPACPSPARRPPSAPPGGSGTPISIAYDEQRERPGADATSRLSPYLKWGCLHPRQLLHKLGDRRPPSARSAPSCAGGSSTPTSCTTGPRRLARPSTPRWRRSRSTAGAPPRGSTPGARAAPATRSSTRGCASWLAEGWMHNRVRMLVASFLVKDLHLDWTRGARYFMEHLVDGDLASNQHGWQWVAGTGTDAAPYFRIFNPVTQGERFDPRRHLRPPLGARARRRAGPVRPPPVGRPGRVRPPGTRRRWSTTPRSATRPCGATPPSAAAEAQPRRARRSASVSDAGRRPGAGQLVGDRLQQRVHRRRHAVEAPEQHDLAVELVDLDAAGAASEALPRGAAAAALARDRAQRDRGRRGARRPPRRRRSRCRRPRSRPRPRPGRRRRGRCSGRSGPTAASSALPRFIRSFDHLNRMIVRVGDRAERRRPRTRPRWPRPARRRRWGSGRRRGSR